MTTKWQKEILKLISWVWSKPFNIIAIWCWQGKDHIDVKISEVKADVTIYDDELEYKATFTADKDITISETAVINENGATLDIDVFTPVYVRAWSSIEITHTITLYDTKQKNMINR